MRNIAKILMFSSALVCSAANAGFQEFTMHSRANCGGFNESISWHFNHSYWLLTNSVHVKPNGNYSCNFWSNDRITLTWRSAACHFAEGYLTDNWIVYGTHYTSNDGGKSTVFMAKTYATDCSIYNGWWDV